MNMEKSLNDLRKEIDSIDDSIHDLIMRRTKIVKKVREVKREEKIKIRPPREAEIIYRLVGRHKGDFPRRELCRMWRELIVATLAMEGPFSAAVFMPKASCGLLDLARDQYGGFTPMIECKTERQVIAAVASQRATVGILPLPIQGKRNPWWRHLMSESPETPKIIARLPFAGAGNGREAGLQALAICPVNHLPNKYNRDHSYFGVESSGKLELGQLITILALQNDNIDSIVSSHKTKNKCLFLVETSEYMEKLTIDEPGVRVFSLGGYALPLSVWELNGGRKET